MPMPLRCQLCIIAMLCLINRGSMMLRRLLMTLCAQNVRESERPEISDSIETQNIAHAELPWIIGRQYRC
jgi:hypothetical protein